MRHARFTAFSVSLGADAGCSVHLFQKSSSREHTSFFIVDSNGESKGSVGMQNLAAERAHRPTSSSLALPARVHTGEEYISEVEKAKKKHGKAQI